MNCDVLFCIFNNLELCDLKPCFLVSKLFNLAIRNDMIWVNQLACNFGVSVTKDHYKSFVKHNRLSRYLFCVTGQKFIDIGDELRISHSYIPTEINLLTGLRRLDLRNNGFEFIPKEIFSLTNLRDLDLGSNRLRNIPREIDLLGNLEYLKLNHNLLFEMPKQVCSLTELYYLKINNNILRSLPSEISNLINLDLLDLQANRLESLPETISLLTNLGSLSLCHNRLSHINYNIVNMASLRTLVIDSSITIPVHLACKVIKVRKVIK
jgi:hypothetical protein